MSILLSFIDFKNGDEDQKFVSNVQDDGSYDITKNRKKGHDFSGLTSRQISAFAKKVYKNESAHMVFRVKKHGVLIENAPKGHTVNIFDNPRVRTF